MRRPLPRGANAAAAALTPAPERRREGGGGGEGAKRREGEGGEYSRDECVIDEAGTLCVKAGMDAENVVVVTIEAPGGGWDDTLGLDQGGRCTAAATAAALAPVTGEVQEGHGRTYVMDRQAGEKEEREGASEAAARAHHGDFGHGGLWSTVAAVSVPTSDIDGGETAVTAPSSAAPPGTSRPATALSSAAPSATSRPAAADDTPAAPQLPDHHHPPPTVAPGGQLGARVSVTRPGSGLRISACMYSLQGYRTDAVIDADIWRRSEMLRGLNAHTLSLHEHAARLGLLPLSSRDARAGQCSMGTLFATILRDECLADLCLYNSGEAPAMQ